MTADRCCVEGCRNETIFFGHSSVLRRAGDAIPDDCATLGKLGIEETLPVDADRPDELGLPKSSPAPSADDSFDSENRFGLNDKLATLLVTYCWSELKKLIVVRVDRWSRAIWAWNEKKVVRHDYYNIFYCTNFGILSPMDDELFFEDSMCAMRHICLKVNMSAMFTLAFTTAHLLFLHIVNPLCTYNIYNDYATKFCLRCSRFRFIIR